jgi:hypothetical protein
VGSLGRPCSGRVAAPPGHRSSAVPRQGGGTTFLERPAEASVVDVSSPVVPVMVVTAPVAPVVDVTTFVVPASPSESEFF